MEQHGAAWSSMEQHGAAWSSMDTVSLNGNPAMKHMLQGLLKIYRNLATKWLFAMINYSKLRSALVILSFGVEIS